MPTETMEMNGLKTCKLTIVNMGASDRVLKVYPAEHEVEKIWLSNTQGIERWEAVKRFLFNYAEKGTRVPTPVPYHADASDLKTVTLKEEDIPIVKLSDGAVLKAPPPEPVMPEIKPPKSEDMAAMETRMSGLESAISQLSLAISGMVLQNKTQNVVATVNNEPKQTATCSKCNETFKDTRGLGAHTRAKHREG